MGKTYCIFSTFYLPNYSGVEKYTANLAHALADLGERVIVVTSALSEDAIGITDDGSVTVARIPSHILINKRFAAPRRGKKLKELMAWLSEQGIDYVLVNQRFYPTSIFGLRFAKKRKLPTITLDHGSAHLTMSNQFIDPVIRLYEHAITFIGRFYRSRYYAVSARSAEWLEHFGIKASGLLYNAIDADVFVEAASDRDFRAELGLSPDAFLVAFTGRLVEEKGVLIACNAVMNLWRKNLDDIHFLMAGDGPMSKVVEAIDCECLHLLGRLSVEDISALLSQSQVFCLPTVSEGFSTSMLEAAAHGMGIVVTDTGGARELVPNTSCGIVLYDDRVDTVEEAIWRYCYDREFLDKCSYGVAARVRHMFTWESTAKELIRAFEEWGKEPTYPLCYSKRSS